MPIISTSGWLINVAVEPRTIATSSFSVKVSVRWFAPPNEKYCMVYLAERVPHDVWVKWLSVCKANAYYDPKIKCWVFTKLSLEKLNKFGQYVNKTSLTDDQRKKLREDRKIAEEKFLAELSEVSKLENIPEDLWPTFNYPSHYQPKLPNPTALQRIIVSRYWNRPASLIAASVGTGKSRMTVDMLSSRMKSDQPQLAISAKITLVVAPLTLHESWKREFNKWSDVDFRIHKFTPTERFWAGVEEDAEEVLEIEGYAGGIVIISTPQALSRTKIIEQFAERGCVPTFIVIDEAQRFFRNPKNKAYKNLLEIRKNAHGIVALTGTPTSEFKDWWSLEELLGNGGAGFHWKDAEWQDYEKASEQETMVHSGLWEPGWSFDRTVKEYHRDRISKGHIFMADKWFYMKDSLPGLEQMELGDFADTRLSFNELFDKYPDFVQAAYDYQKKENPESLQDISETSLAQVLLLRMQQLAANSGVNSGLLEEFVSDFLDDGEPAVIWTMFRDELQSVASLLGASYGKTEVILGDQKTDDRWKAIDNFQEGRSRFMVSQIQAGGVGLTLVRAKKCLFLSLPFSYLDITQAIGRLHRIGQKEDVTSYFAMTSPVSAFSRGIYDSRAHLNEVIPQNISGVMTKLKK